jgi:hypothetical protein
MLETAEDAAERIKAEAEEAEKKKIIPLKDRPNHDGLTPIGAAARNGHVEIVRYLVKVGAVLDKPDSDGHTPLYEAAYVVMLLWGVVVLPRFSIRSALCWSLCVSLSLSLCIMSVSRVSIRRLATSLPC